MASWSRPVAAAIVTAAIRPGRSASSHARASSRPVNSAGTGVPASARRCLSARPRALRYQASSRSTACVPLAGTGVGDLAGVQAQQVVHPPPARAPRRPRPGAPGPAGRSTARARPAGQPASSAAASVDTSGPGSAGSSRNIRAASSSSCRYDNSNAAATDGALTPLPSSYRSASRRRTSSAISAASSAAVSAGSATSSAAVICSASGSPPHAPASLPAATGSPPIRSSSGRAARTTWSRSCTAAAWSRTVTSSSRAPSPARVCREVMMTRCGPGPGISSRTCASAEALSATTSTGSAICASADRYSPARCSAPSGMCSPGTPSARSSASSAWPGCTGLWS